MHLAYAYHDYLHFKRDKANKIFVLVVSMIAKEKGILAADNLDLNC